MTRTVSVLVACLAVAALGLSGCGADGATTRGDAVARLDVWAHDGTPAERRVLEDQVAAFNRTRGDTQVTIRFVAEGDYNDELQAAVASGEVPDVAEVDGPLVGAYVYQDVLTPLEGLLDAAALGDQLPSLKAQGAHDGHTYAVGTFDSGLGLYADRRALQEAGVAWPTSLAEAWSAREFSDVLAALAATDPDGKVLDVKLNYGGGEWLTYGFAPLVASAGGQLIDPSTYSPAGHLDGPAARSALTTLRGWSRYVDPNGADDAFVDRRAAMSWVGHWTYADYAKALGDDLLVLPLPDLGNGTKTGQGSWAWTVTARDDGHRQAAARFLEFLLADAEVLRMTAANGAVPGTRSALAASPLYASDGPLRIFADQLLASCGTEPPSAGCVAVPRPATPGYAVLSSQFAKAVSVALSGKDPAPALAEAAGFVEQDLVANHGFR